MSDRPNVVVVLTDQQTADAMSCADNPDVATPAMDALAATGVRFTRAYCTQPLCTPSRASMWTGRMPTELGVTVNNRGIPPEFADDQLGRLFTASGYDTGYVGKWHVPQGVDETSGFTTRVGVLPDDDLAQASAEFIRTQREDPFLLVTSFNEPHGICQWARSQPPPSGPIPEPPADAWPALPMNYQPSSYDAELPRLARDRTPQTHPIAGWTEDDWRRYRHAYYRLCERVDASLGRILTALETSGQRENTLIMFSSDHGDGLGAHQWNQKWVLTEESARVPLIIAPPAATNQVGRVAVDDRLVSVGLDLLPTVCDYAGIATPSGLRGRSLRALVDGRDDLPWRDHVISETTWDAPGMNQATGRMVRTGRYKYICYSWGRHREQLFDLHHDPGEMGNLATTHAHIDALHEHRQLLAAHCDQTGDRFAARYLPTHPALELA